MKAVTWQGQARRPGRGGARPDDRGADGRDHPAHLDQHLRVRSPPLRGARTVHEPRRRPRPRADGRRGGGRLSEVAEPRPGDRVVIPFQISCGSCFMCNQGLQTQCETTQVRDQGTGAALFGYSKLYGSVPGGQAEYLRVPQAQYTHIKVPEGPPDDRFVYLSDVLPTAWQGVDVRRSAHGRHAGRARSRSDRRHGLPDRRPPRRTTGHRRRPRARATRASACPGSQVIDLNQTKDLVGADPRAHRRSRRRRSARCGRHGGARVAR